MTIKDFFKQFSGRQEPHVMIDQEGEPLGVLLSYDRYVALTRGEQQRSQNGADVRTDSVVHSQPTVKSASAHIVPTQTAEPAPFRWDAAVEESEEPHFQFEPIEEEGDLTS